ncbi:MAG: hypothetical protein HYX96_07490 [Chloroflexi bacterium]|nr:hypothetical protein [Chloroflexota bacterium]
MENRLLELIGAYQERIVVVENVVAAAYEATIIADEGLSRAMEERVKLKSHLGETLARNCSLRKRDFERVMEAILNDTDASKRQIDEERRLVRELLKCYLRKQKGLTVLLKEQLTRLDAGLANAGDIESILEKIKSSFQDDGRQIFARLDKFQLSLQRCRREQESLNQKMKSATEKGKLLRFEHIKELGGVSAGDKPPASRRARHKDARRLLVLSESREAS